MDYEKLSDENIIAKTKSGDKEALDYILNKYKHLVKLKARAYFLVGADSEDLIQEGMIGLYKAIRDYDNLKEIPFKSFADLCITRQIISAIRTASRQKHRPLNSYVSFESDETDRLLIENPEYDFIIKEDAINLEQKLEKILSKFELDVYKHYRNNKSYTEIALITKKTNKQIDNTLQRIKRKIQSMI